MKKYKKKQEHRKINYKLPYTARIPTIVFISQRLKVLLPYDRNVLKEWLTCDQPVSHDANNSREFIMYE